MVPFIFVIVIQNRNIERGEVKEKAICETLQIVFPKVWIEKHYVWVAQTEYY